MRNDTIEGYTKCACGAITVFMGGASYSCKQKNLKRFFPSLDLRKINRIYKQKTHSCDHCVNHYGLDLCACGSGEPYETCRNGMDVCGTPMSVAGEYTRVCDKNGWVRA